MKVCWAAAVLVVAAGLWLVPGALAESAGIGGDQPIISAVRIRIADPPPRPDPRIWKAMAETLIDIRSGDRLTASGLSAAIGALEAAGQFAAIHADTAAGDGGVVLDFALTPVRRIKDIRIYGQFPLFEKEILRVLTLAPGDAFSQKKADAQSDRVRRLYRQEGFAAPQVVVGVQEDVQDGQKVLEIRIRPGAYRRIAKIDIVGNRRFSDGRLKWLTKTWLRSKLPGRAGRFAENLLAADVDALVRFYRKHGYAEATVDAATQKAAQDGWLRLRFTVREGPRYTFEFEGNRHFSDRDLQRDLVVFDAGNRNDFGLQKSVRRIGKRYRKSGFADATVAYETEAGAAADGPVRRVRIRISEGTRTTVEAIDVTGNRSIPNRALTDVMLTRPPGVLSDGAYVPEVLDADMDAIQSVYMQHGFARSEAIPHVTVNPEKGTAAIRIAVDEGVRTRVSAVDVEGIRSIDRSRALAAIALRPGEPFRAYMLRSDENTLAALISETGHPHVTVTATVVTSDDRRRATITYRADEGPLVRMGRVFCSGNFKTRYAVVRERIPLATGDPFALKKLLQGERNIRDLGLFASVRFKTVGLREKADTVDLFVALEEKRPYYLESGIGYDTQNGAYADGRLGDRNLMGAHLDVWLDAGLSEVGRRAQIGLTDPRFADTPISADFRLYTQQVSEFNQDFGVRSTGAAATFSHRWRDHLSTGMGFRIERRRQFDKAEAEAIVSDELDRRTLFVVTPSVQYDTRDSVIRPRKGLLSTVSADISTGLENDVDDFYKANWDIRYYYTPVDRLTLAFSGRIGFLDPFGSAGGVPEDQLFFLGGTADVRGFGENLLRFDADGEPVGGRVAIAGTVEARIDLGRQFELACFFDTGRISETAQAAVQASGGFRSSAGIGLRYVTPIGPVGLLYGHKLDRIPGESAGRIHFTIGYTF